MKSNNFLIPVIMLLTVFSVQSFDHSNIKLSAINFGTGFVVGVVEGGLNRANNVENPIYKKAVVAATAGYTQIVRQALVQHDPTLGKESKQNQTFLSMTGQALGQFVTEGIQFEHGNYSPESMKFKFSVNLSLLVPLIYRAACQAEVLYETYGDRLWPKKN